jgi:hypothetical protein
LSSMTCSLGPREMREQCRGLAVWQHRCMPDRISVRAAWRGVAVFRRASVGSQAYMRLEKRSCAWTCVERERIVGLAWWNAVLSMHQWSSLPAELGPRMREIVGAPGSIGGVLICIATHSVYTARVCTHVRAPARVPARVCACVCRACALRLRVQARVHVCGSDVGHRCTVGRGRSVARAVIVPACVLHADRVKWPRKRQRLRQRAPH